MTNSRSVKKKSKHMKKIASYRLKNYNRRLTLKNFSQSSNTAVAKRFTKVSKIS